MKLTVVWAAEDCMNVSSLKKKVETTTVWEHKERTRWSHFYVVYVHLSPRVGVRLGVCLYVSGSHSDCVLRGQEF